MAQISSSYICNNLEDTQKFALEFAAKIKPGSIFAFYGELGTGKTTFIQIVLNFFGIPNNQIQSPTFSYLHSYERLNSKFNIYHFDLYRLKSEKEFLALGFEEYLTDNNVCFIEWAEKIKTILPIEKTVNINIKYIDEFKRKIEIFNE
jgi:tRNA threonylcarbamoyladenosine biosynthesis protein TsaE